MFGRRQGEPTRRKTRQKTYGKAAFAFTYGLALQPEGSEGGSHSHVFHTSSGSGTFLDLPHFTFWRSKMNFIIWIIVGGILGWVARMIMRTDAQQGMFLNVIVGIIGALLGGWLLAPLFGSGTINQNDFSIGSLLVSLLGAVVLLAIVNLFRRGTPR